MRKVVKKLPKLIKSGSLLTLQTFSFVVLLLSYLFSLLFIKISHILPKKLVLAIQKPFKKIWQLIIAKFDPGQSKSISRIDLIELSLSNLQVKKTRTMITIGGIALGVAAIVFLVSLGYGLQNVVVSRVARLEEMRQAEITTPSGGKLALNDETLADFQNLNQVETALPLISVVGRVNYQGAISDMAVYGVTTQYLEQSAIKPIRGSIFHNDKLALDSNIQAQVELETNGQVAGATTDQGEFAQRIRAVEFNIEPEVWLRVREEPSTNSKIIGYTRRVEGRQSGYEVWGDQYLYQEQELNKWIEGKFLLWQHGEEGYQPAVSSEQEGQVQAEGYLGQIALNTTFLTPGQVLGSTTDEESNGIEWVDLATDSAKVDENLVTVKIDQSETRKAVVNQAVLKILNIEENQAIGQKFEAEFVAMGQSLGESEKKAKSTPIEYEIVGVIPGEKTPLFYVPFVDLRQLGVVNYDQVKISVNDQTDLSDARRKIEAMGFVTRSVTDTVRQIKGLFATVRTVLAFLGMTALIVASLGMFNTLTVSLLERTREVGLMKAMGMKSQEVKELFLTESMIMGLFGGLLGIVVGFAAGKLLSLIVSIFAILKGVGFINLTVIPFGFVLLILFLSLFVGVATGLYPARRATKISALNALRYE
ncbi:MAG: FtsX-like permease family protein [Candidatus Pacebacteria bacterium]|nr:FtsX-like permease family protein [Candidatus Paceibacterota bacterium]